MDDQAFREWAARAADWAANYRATLAHQPVRAQTAPGVIAGQIPAQAPEMPEEMRAIFADFERIILPGMTHWQHPRFFAYFPANASPVSIIAEILVSAMAAQCMLWQTSPAATELETVMMQWLRQAVGLPDNSRASSRIPRPQRPSRPSSPCGSARSALPVTHMASQHSRQSESMPRTRRIPRSIKPFG
jgi:hypothetical protein